MFVRLPNVPDVAHSLPVGSRLNPFYPTALKGCRGIVFTHGVRMGGRREIVCPGCISETVRCSSYVAGTLVRGCRCATSWSDLDFDL